MTPSRPSPRKDRVRKVQSSAATRSMREHPDFDQLKRQAKELLKDFRAGERKARTEVRSHYRDAKPDAFALSDAQLVVARAYGFESWQALTREVRKVRAVSKDLPSKRMTQPEHMRGCELRRDGVAVDGDQAWAMFCACADGDESAVRTLIEKNPDLNYAQIWYHKPIELALREGHLPVVKILFESDVTRRLARAVYGPWVYKINRREVLHRGYVELDRFLMDYKRRLAPRFDESFERLKAAIESKKVEQVRAVLDAQPDLLHATDFHGSGALYWAVWHRQLDMVEFFLDRGADINEARGDGMTPLTLSLRNDAAMTAYLLARGATCTLGAAAAVGHQGKAAAILRDDPGAARRLDANEYAPIRYAASGGHVEIVQLLLDHGADPNMPEQDAPDGAALFEACLKDRRDVIKLLLARGANANAEYDSCGSCLQRYNGAAYFSQMLRDHGAFDPSWSLNAEQMKTALREDRPVIKSLGHHGWGGFHQMVVKHQDIELLDMLVEKAGPEPIRSLSWWDAFATNPAFVDRLVHHGLDVNRRDWLGRTVLHWCAEKGEVVPMLKYLECGADINAVDVRERTTPLGYAARKGKVDMIRALLDAGADPNLPHDAPWARPLAYAEFENQTDAVRLLKQ